MSKETAAKSLLSDFLLKFEQIPNDIIESLHKVTDDADEKNVINSFAPTLVNQFKELSSFVVEKSSRASSEGLRNSEQFLKISSGNSLVNNLKLSLPSIGSIVGKLGISGIIQEIKKIVMGILEAFGITLPKWLTKIINLIDEIINDLLGGGSIKMHTALSQKEQNYLAELTHLARLERASEFKYSDDEEED
ncbi:MAG: hypothetical protein J0M18_15150 [Ignavibacteria bacterium]|nr:hypothetical protein [Ignavibacteria bacterium]